MDVVGALPAPLAGPEVHPLKDSVQEAEGRPRGGRGVEVDRGGLSGGGRRPGQGAEEDEGGHASQPFPHFLD